MAINIDTNTDGDVTYQNPPVNRVLFPNITDHATPEEIQAAVDAWLEDHPEATTTVQDGSILPVKLDSSNDAADGYVLSWNATDEQFEWVNVQADIDDLKQDFNEYHPDLGSGYSAQLLSTVFIENEVPYNFRTSGGSADIGDREYDEIVGVSMPVNQLVAELNSSNWEAESGATVSFNNGVITVSSQTVNNGAASKIYADIKLHTYFIAFDAKGTSGVRAGLTVSGASGLAYDLTMDGNWMHASTIKECVDGVGKRKAYLLGRNSTYENLQFKNAILIDLTLMLGTSIADYVYGLEQSTAGSGVTWLKHHFPKIFDSGYIPYTAGEMQSVSGLSLHRMTGFNQWDEEYRQGIFNNQTGQFIPFEGYLASKNYIKVLPGATYFFHIGSVASSARDRYFYDADGNFISAQTNTYVDTTFTVPENAYYMQFSLGGAYGSTYKNDICINLHWDGERDGEYEEYKEYEYALDDSVVLRGILKLDSSNSLYADGDRYLPDGTVERTWGEVDLGTLSWGYNAISGRMESNSTPITDAKAPSDNITALVGICARYMINPANATNDKTLVMNTSKQLRVYDSGFTDAATFTATMSGVKLVYFKETPTTETAEPYQTPQIVDEWGTEEYVSTSLVPVGHDTKYANNLRAKLEMSPDSPEEDGDYIVRHNNGENEYVALGSTTTIQGILDRLTALENA